MTRVLRPRVLILTFIFTALASGVWAAADKVKITNVSNINFGNWAFSSLSANDPVCVYRQSGGTAYTVTASNAPNGGFFLKKTNGTTLIPFTMLWSNTPSPGSLPLSHGVTLNADGAHTSSASCNNGHTANFTVNVNNSDLSAAPSGTYKATVTIDIST